VSNKPSEQAPETLNPSGLRESLGIGEEASHRAGRLEAYTFEAENKPPSIVNEIVKAHKQDCRNLMETIKRECPFLLQQWVTDYVLSMAYPNYSASKLDARLEAIFRKDLDSMKTVSPRQAAIKVREAMGSPLRAHPHFLRVAQRKKELLRQQDAYHAKKQAKKKG
jgi:hypothetical protein